MDDHNFFLKSLEWPVNNGTIMLQKSVTDNERQGSFIHVSDALDRNLANDVRYLCINKSLNSTVIPIFNQQRGDSNLNMKGKDYYCAHTKQYQTVKVFL